MISRDIEDTVLRAQICDWGNVVSILLYRSIGDVTGQNNQANAENPPDLGEVLPLAVVA